MVLLDSSQCYLKGCAEHDQNVRSRQLSLGKKIETLYSEYLVSDGIKPIAEISEQDARIRDIVLGLNLLDASRSGDKDAVLRILSEITCFDSLKMVDDDNRTAASHLLSKGMIGVVRKIYEREFLCLIKACKARDFMQFKYIYQQIDRNSADCNFGLIMMDVARKIYNIEFSALIDACKAKDLKRFEYICEQIGRGFFRYTNYTADNFTLIVDTYSDVLSDNFKNGLTTTVSLNSVVSERPLAETYSRPLKRAATYDLRQRNYGICKAEDVTCEAVSAAQFLNACKRGDILEAMYILANKIKNYKSLEFMDGAKSTALSYAEASGMNDVVNEINNKKFALYLDAFKNGRLDDDKKFQLLLVVCKNGDLESFMLIHKELGNRIYKHKEYTAEDLTLICATHSEALRSDWENGLERGLVSINFADVRAQESSGNNLKRSLEDDLSCITRNIRMIKLKEASEYS